ncbi:MAG: LPS-assembly protein LptD [Chlamydiae bacterium]|nr:LPS-assembly protein LptD [Chlamydiota bacterium]
MKKKPFILILCVLILYAFDEPEDSFSSLSQTLFDKSQKKTENTEKQKPYELIVDLRNPSFTNGILTTSEGGVIKGGDIRIQAKTIQYIKKNQEGKAIHRIEADGDLMIQYKDRIYVGQELEYDFITGTGIIYNGKTFSSPWYLGGDKIELKSDGSYHVENVFITTCENADSSWDLHAKRVNVYKKDMLQAKKVRFRLFKFPTLWLPSFKLNLKKFTTSPMIRYKFNWDKSSGPRASFRYRLYSWEDLAFFGRVDYRLKRGFGGAVETEYYPEHKRTTFETKNYLATDVIPNNIKDERRYRVQGALHHTSISQKTTVDVTWDKYSDVYMPADFKSDDFEINTAKRTEFSLRHEKNNMIAILYAHPRVNPFETIKQDIPTAYLNIRPIKLPVIDTISYNWFKVSYMDYVYSNTLEPSLKDIHSSRLETHNELYQPIHFSVFNFTPYVGFDGIIYGNNPITHSTITQAVLLYGGTLKTSIYKTYTEHKHLIEPYITYEGITHPLKPVDTYYIFSIQDGYNRINLIRPGIKNQYFSYTHHKGVPTIVADLYTTYFIDPKKISNFYKLYFDWTWNLPSLYFLTNIAWNFDHETLDFSNFRLGWTANKNVAFALEFRYRSQFDYRKSDYENFILDVTRSQDALLDSPLSDKRNTIITHAFFRLNPYWTCHLESHHGFNRSKEPFYNEYKIDLFTMLSTAWKVRISYQHSQKDDRFTGAIVLIK